VKRATDETFALRLLVGFLRRYQCPEQCPVTDY
jgi:hypothetical protein